MMRLIHLFTDFGFDGPYVGEMTAVLERQIEMYKVIDLMHDVPKFNIRAGACLLSALSRRFVKHDACLAIVDPDVGSTSRRPILLVADEVIYCGPDNGLFSELAKNATTLECYEIIWRPETLSSSFHGRDLFAPSLVNFLENKKKCFERQAMDSMIGMDESKQDEVIYFDRFGNAITSLKSDSISIKHKIIINDTNLSYAETFSSVAKDELFWYANSMGLVELAINQGSAKRKLNLQIGTIIRAD